MIDFEKHKMYIIVAVLIVIVGLYFGHTWHVNKLIDDKFRKITKERRKKQTRVVRNTKINNKHVQKDNDYIQKDMDDSYIDPGDGGLDDDGGVHG